MMLDERENRIKKLKMRSMRRGIKEMDVILSYYSEVCLEKMPGVKLDLYSDLLFENDQDLYSWCSGQAIPKKKVYCDYLRDTRCSKDKKIQLGSVSSSFYFNKYN